MSRPPRLQFPGATYHVTARGDRREAIFVDDTDRRVLLRIVGGAMERFDATQLAFCLMGNHYHFVLHTRRANLSQLMKHVNGVYTQVFNRRHSKVGHVFQGRFKSILVDRDAYLTEVCRYVDLNPVRAGLVADPARWPWSSCRVHLGRAGALPWLDSAWLLGHVLGRPVATALDQRAARGRYAELLAAGRGVPLWPEGLRQQVYLGDDAFIGRMQAAGIGAGRVNVEMPREETKPSRTLQEWLALGPTRERGLRQAHVAGGLSLTAMARELGLSVSRVSRLVARAAPAQG